MQPYADGPWGRLYCADARDALKALDDASCDAVITDPPYALTSGKNSTKGFMSAQWDNGSVAHDPAFWAEVLRVARPGAFLLAFGGCRTYHRLVCAIEDGGWQPREMLNWVFATGFPKSKSCLKPSHEPIVLAKAPGPLQPLQIDACRLPTGEGLGRPKGTHNAFPFSDDAWGNGPLTHTEGHSGGRWPPNTLFSHVSGPDGCRPAGVRRVRGAGWRDTDVGDHSRAAVFDDERSGLGASTSPHYADADGYETMDAYQCVDGCPVAELDRQAGPRPSGAVTHQAGATITDSWRTSEGRTDTHRRANDNAWPATTGSASRFFPTFPGADPEDAVPFRYQPKAPPAERRLTDGTPTGHPTQKPVALAQWLVTLVCAPGGTVLDPFAGVGSLGVGALRAGCHYLGIEQDAGYAAVAQRRLDEEQERADGQLALPLGHACG